MSEQDCFVIKDAKLIHVLIENGYSCKPKGGGWYQTNIEIEHGQALRLSSGDIIKKSGTYLLLLKRNLRTDIPLAVEDITVVQTVQFQCIECQDFMSITQSFPGSAMRNERCRTCHSVYEVSWSPGGGMKVYVVKLPDNIQEK